MLKEISRQFDIGASGVSQTSRRIAMKISQDNKLSKKIGKIENKLNLSRMKTPMSPIGMHPVMAHNFKFFLISLSKREFLSLISRKLLQTCSLDE